jgi:two-component system cell cycle response regulator
MSASNKPPKSPAQPTGPHASGPGIAAALQSTGRAPSYHVLLIEENPEQSELYSELIREVAECKVDVMSQVESSFTWVAQLNYHLVVIDASASSRDTGGMRSLTSGAALRLLEQIKRLSPFTSVIIMSEHASVEHAVSAIRLGAEDYLKKPFNLESFQLAIKRGLDRKAIFERETGASSFLSLINACQMISSTMDQQKIFDIVQSYLSRELKSDHTAIYCLQKDDPLRVDDGAHAKQQDRAMNEILGIALHASNALKQMRDNREDARLVERGQLTPSLFILRFRCAGQADYFCVCLSPEPISDREAFDDRMRMLRAQLEMTGKNIEQYQGVQHLVYVDDATGLYNTRYLNNILDREIAIATQKKSSFAILFIDADKFKQVNDGHGHLVGTKLLHELGHVLKKLTRDSDTVFRYGGDEFVAVLSPCDLQTAQLVAERIRSAVESRSFIESEGLNLRFTVSIGVALFPDHARTKKEIIEAADHAMYAAKKKSRNSVTIATTSIKQAASKG